MTRITVIGLARAAPGRADDIVRAMEERLQHAGGGALGRLDGYMLEEADDPSSLALIARWASRAAFEAYRRRHPLVGDPAWFAERPAPLIYEPLATRIDMYVRSEVACLTFVEAPPASAPAFRERLLAYCRTTLAGTPGTVEHELAARDGASGSFVAFVRWSSAAAMAAYEDGEGRRILDELRADGADVRRFCWRQRAEMPWDIP